VTVIHVTMYTISACTKSTN